MASTRDYYDVLGVAKSASDAEIKKAYRSLARKYHPDVYKGTDAEDTFKEINEAYQVLSDPQKRGAYDQFGHNAFNQSAGNTGGWSSQGVDFSGFGDFRDPFEIFEEFFGSRSPFGGGFGASGRRRSSTYDGEDLHFELTIPFEDAVFGTERMVTLERIAQCSECSGSGAAKGAKKVTCSTCQGRGVVQRATQSIFGNLLTNMVCEPCGGTGEIPEKPCPKCKGQTVVRIEEKRSLKIPAGVDDGSAIRYQGLGNGGPHGGSYGDLYLTVRVLPSKEFRREGTTLMTELPISFVQAALGDEVQVKTVDGYEKLKITSGTQPGEEIRLKGKGVPSLQGRQRGDHIVKIQVQIPKHLSGKQKELLKEFES